MNSPIALIGVLLATAPAKTALAQINERTVQPFALTISGGVSLGAYEAGLNWALVSFVKRANALASEPAVPRPRLVAIAGASAGSINALLAAAVWCQRPDEHQVSTVDHNLLRDTWIPVGFDQLLPDDPSLYLREDALLSRRGLIAELENVRRKVFDQKDGYAFLPGCQIPVGFTVTRTAPRQTQVEGLSTLTQRFVIPLVFEVTPAGWVRLRPQTLLPDRESSDYLLRLAESREDSGESSVSGEQASQAILASGAFPLAFSPRQLCSCELTCPEERIVTNGSCRGLDPAHPLGGLTCASLSSPERNLKLCRWEYVDGGIFDNAPLGLAIDQAESWQSPALLRPVRYGFEDPDVRRSQSSSSTQGITGSQRGLAGSLQLLGNLISTSRNADLARVIKAKNWNRTTETLLRELAVTLSQFVFVFDLLQRLADEKTIAEDVALPESVEGVRDRTRLGRLLYQCLEQLQDTRRIKSNLPLLSRCANEAREAEPRRRLADSLERSGALQPLTAAEVTSLAGWLEAFIGVGRNTADTLNAIPPARRSAVPERARQEFFTDAVKLGALGFQYLAGELPRVAHSQLPEEEIREFRDGLLQAMALSERLSFSTKRLANAVVMEYLTRLGNGSGPLSAKALTALEASRGLGRSELFEVETLAPVVESVRAAAASPIDGEQQQLGAWLQQGDGLLKLRPMLQQLFSKISTLVQSASELQEQGSGERLLLPTSRFAPLAGSQLLNFAAFLDRPLREFDYYAGVYDAVHEMAVRLCAEQDPFGFNLPVPESRWKAPFELDPRSLATQRCIGAGMSRIANVLRLSNSTKARQIFSGLATAELAVGLGDQAAAQRLLAENDWLWLREYSSVVQHDSLGVVLETLLSRREPCTNDAKQSLCIAEPSFEEFIASLRARGYEPEESNMRLVLTDPDRFWKSTLKKLADRSAAVELSRSDPGSSFKQTVLFGIGATELWTRRALAKSSPPRLVIDPSSLPGEPLPYTRGWTLAAVHLIPYRIELDVSRGGVALAWLEPELLLTGSLSIASIVEPLDFESQGSHFSSTVGALPTVHLAGVSLGAGPRFSLHWPTSKGTDLGLEARLSILQDRFSVGMGLRQVAGADRLRNWFVFLAVSDVNGMIYWLGPWKSKSP